MKLNNLTFIVTNQCNFNCTYCMQSRDNRTLDTTIVDRAVDCFYPHFSNDEKVVVGFYGGEPLLEFHVVEHTVKRFQHINKGGGKGIEFALTTNGSLIDREMLDFFEEHGFMLTLSFDGLAQDMGRKGNSRLDTLALMKEIQSYSNINLEINSVFSPETVDRLTDSILYIVDEGGPEVTFNVSYMQPWKPGDISCLDNELARLSTALVNIFRETGKIPVTNFKTPPCHGSVFRCNAGKSRMAVAPGGDLWGCFLFYDFFKDKLDHRQYEDFSLGSLMEFENSGKGRYSEKMGNYAQLRQDYFQVEGGYCFLCEELHSCTMCPVNAAFGSGSPGKIPCSKCRLSKIQSRARKNFHETISLIAPVT